MRQMVLDIYMKVCEDLICFSSYTADNFVNDNIARIITPKE